MAMPPIEAPVSAHCLDPLPNRNVTNSRPTRPECPCESGTPFRPGQKSDHRHCPLRARRERPCGCAAAEKGDEIAPPHGAYPQGSWVKYSRSGRASQQKRPAHVRFGSFASKVVRPAYCLCPQYLPKRTSVQRVGAEGTIDAFSENCAI